MIQEQKERMLKFLGKEGCPDKALISLDRWIDTHPGATIGQANVQLNIIAAQYGHTSYKSFRDYGFLPLLRDEILGGSMVSVPA